MASVSSARGTCPSCGAEPRSALVCESCGTLLDPHESGPFEALGLAPSYALDPAETRRRLLALSRALHPDFHSTAGPAARRRSEDNTAALNAAYRILADDALRADWLVKRLGGPDETEERSMPSEFLLEVLEWNEAIEEARGAAPESPSRQALASLEESLRAERAATLERLARLLTPLPAPASGELRTARQLLNSLRYLDRALAEIGELRLAPRS